MNTKLLALRYLRIIKNWLWLLILGGLLAGAANFFLTSSPARYQAHTTVIVGQLLQQAVPDQNDAPLIERLTSYYVELLRRQPVLDGVKKELNLNITNDNLLLMLTASVVPQTSIIEISIVNTNQTLTVQLANSFAHQLINQSPTAPVNEQKSQRDFIQSQLQALQTQIETATKNLDSLNTALNNTTTAAEIADIRSQIKAGQTQLETLQSNYTDLLRQSTAASPNTLTILEEANQATQVKDLSPLIKTLIFALAGVVVAFGFAVLLEYLDDRVKTPEDITYRLKAPLLAQLPALTGVETAGGDISRNNHRLEQKIDDAYEILSTSLIFTDDASLQYRSIMLTAPGEIAEQSAVIKKLATTLVSAGQEVLLVDANVEKPKLHEFFDIPNSNGFYELLYQEELLVKTKIHPTTLTNLNIMPAGRVPNAAEINDTFLPVHLNDIYNMMQYQISNMVLFNGGPVLENKTTRLLTPRINNIVLLCKLKDTRMQELRAAIDLIDRLKGNFLGVVLLEPTGLLGTDTGRKRKNRHPMRVTAKTETIERQPNSILTQTGTAEYSDEDGDRDEDASEEKSRPVLKRATIISNGSGINDLRSVSNKPETIQEPAADGTGIDPNLDVADVEYDEAFDTELGKRMNMSEKELKKRLSLTDPSSKSRGKTTKPAASQKVRSETNPTAEG